MRQFDQPDAAGDLPHRAGDLRRRAGAAVAIGAAADKSARTTRPGNGGLGIGVMVGPIIGPALGGWLTENYDWRWIFYINLPVGVVASIGILLFIRTIGRAVASRSISSDF